MFVESVFCAVVMRDPRHGEGWDEIVEGDEEVLGEAFETGESGGVDYEAYGFDSMGGLVDYVDRHGFEVGDGDYERKKRELKNDRWEVPGRLEEFDSFDSVDDALPPDVDTTAETDWWVEVSEARRQEKDTRYNAVFTAYDDSGEYRGSNFVFQVSWYDVEPEEVSYEELFSWDEE